MLYNWRVKPEQQLKLFVRRVRELGNRRMVRESMGYNLSLNYNQVAGLSFSFNQPDEEDLRSFLLTFRQFISPDEPVHINRIYNICFKCLKPNNKLKDYLIQSRRVKPRRKPRDP